MIKKWIGDPYALCLWVLLLGGEILALGIAVWEQSIAASISAGVLAVYVVLAVWSGQTPILGQSSHYRRHKQAKKILRPSCSLKGVSVNLTNDEDAEQWTEHSERFSQAWQTVRDENAKMDDRHAANVYLETWHRQSPGPIGEMAKHLVIEMYAKYGARILAHDQTWSSEAQVIFNATYAGMCTAKSARAVNEAIKWYQQDVLAYDPALVQANHSTITVFDKANPLRRMHITPSADQCLERIRRRVRDFSDPKP